MRRWRIKLILMALGFSFLCSSCALVVVNYPQGWMGWPERVVYDRTFPLPSGGTADFLIDKVEAQVEIRGWEKEEVRVRAHQGQPFSRRGWVVAGQRANAPRIDVDTSDSLLRIRVTGREPQVFPLRLEIQVPRRVELNQIRSQQGDISIRDLFGLIVVNLESGSLEMKNVSGSVDATLRKGNIEAEVLDLREGDEVKLTTREGDIALFLEPEVSARLQAQTSEGKISCEFWAEEPFDDHVSTVLGEGKAMISLTASRGNIRIKKTE